jgi:hypothetical protein
MIRLRFMPLLVGVAALVFPAVATAGPDPTRASLASQASYVSPQQINLEVRLSCPAGLSFFVSADVIQQQGLFTQVFGNGFTNGVCTGQRQNVAVPVFSFWFPGWQLGDALASVTACAFTCDSAARPIRIVL